MKIPASDSELWALFAGGDREAFSALFKRMYPLLYQYGHKIVPGSEAVEDAIQELFIELWQRRDKPEVTSVRSYLLTALKFKLFKSLRTGVHIVTAVDEDTSSFELSHETFLIEKEMDDERFKAVMVALNRLPARQKEMVYLRIYKGLSYEEISAVMDINYQVLRNLLCQALKTVRKHCDCTV